MTTAELLRQIDRLRIELAPFVAMAPVLLRPVVGNIVNRLLNVLAELAQRQPSGENKNG